MTPAEFVDRLRTENGAFYQDPRGKGALKDLQVVFPVPWIYLAELVQNAIDAKATRIKFESGLAGGLVLEHDGNAFSERDVYALCTRGVSTKSTNTVGFMGVGFKSVFKAYEDVVISSGDWRFRLTVPSDMDSGVRQWIGAVLPTWDSTAEPPSEGYACRFEMSRRVSSGTGEGDLGQLLRGGESLLPLLAWNGVVELTVGGRHWELDPKEVPLADGDASKVRVSAVEQDGSRRQWLLFVKTYQPSEPAVLRFLQHRQIQPAPDERESVLLAARRLREVVLFCELSSDGSPLLVNRGQCFSLLPTGQTTCLGLHLQAEWLLDISRREPMRISGDAWQEEIILQVPYLLRAYLEWLVSDETDGAENWANGYEAFPGPGDENELDTALRAHQAKTSLCALLEDCEFLPFDSPADRIEFASPRDARLLPDALRGAVGRASGIPPEIFGPKIVESDTLGPRATAFLLDTGLLDRLTPAELTEHWADGKLGSWYDAGGDTRDAAYTRLIIGLAGLDSVQEWSEAELRCLPAPDGTWHMRRGLSRYPANWANLSPSPIVRAALETFVGEPAHLLDWRVDQLLRRDASAQRFLDVLETTALEDVASQWWSTLSDEPAQAERELVVAFTDLVRRQRSLPLPVPRVLAVQGGAERLLAIDQVLVAEPYSGNYRKALFPGVPTLSEFYLASVSEATDADWRAFFESQTPAPTGRPVLYFKKSVAESDDIAAAGTLPRRRVTYTSANWRGLNIDSSDYYVADTALPSKVLEALERPEVLTSLAIQRWMLEQPGLYRTWKQPSIAFIPLGSSSPSSVTLSREAQWLKDLKRRRWLFDHAGKGPYRPDEVLATADASRPEAPVAQLADGFGALAAELGLTFGHTIPNAPAIDRLRALGPSADWTNIEGLVRDAVAEADEDESKAALLEAVLSDQPLFPLPDGRRTPDRRSRVGTRRMVLGSRRSTLADWVCAWDSYPEGGSESEVLRAVSTVLTLPEATTARHAAEFLGWVWENEPDADTVRQVLPRAYQYLVELPDDELELVRADAKVYVTTRRWVRVRDGNVFLNDLDIPDKDILAADDETFLATPGHLGDDDSSRQRTCDLLGLELASTRYGVEVREELGGVVTPEPWRSEFNIAQQRFWRKLADDESGMEAPPSLDLVCVRAITRLLTKDGQQIDEVGADVAIRGTRAYVVGDPLEFAPPLSEALIEHWGIALRRDGYALGSRLTGFLSRIDRTTDSARDTGDAFSQDENREGTEQTEEPDTGASDESRGKKTSSGGGGEGSGGGEHGDPSYTTGRKDAQHTALLKRRQELSVALRNVERLIKEGLGSEVFPEEDTGSGGDRPKAFGTDAEYRQAVAEFETANGRYPELRDKDQAGFDIDSYSHDVEHPDRLLIRRIEVKGKGTLWSGDEIVELSDRQLKDALVQRTDEQDKRSPGFDYWLYVVETIGGVRQVLPIRNPALRAAKFEFRAAQWRAEVDTGPGE